MAQGAGDSQTVAVNPRPSGGVVMDDLTEEQVRALLTRIDGSSREIWRNVGMGLKDRTSHLPETVAFELWDSWAQKFDGYNEEEQATQWKSFKDGEIHFGTVIWLAKQGKWVDPREAHHRNGTGPQKQHDYELIWPIPDGEVPDPSEQLGKFLGQTLGATAAERYVYRNAADLRLMCTFRFTIPGTKRGKPKKTIRPAMLFRDRKTGRLQWRSKWPELRPIYGLARLAKYPGKPALLVFGEKKCQAAAKLLEEFFVVVSLACGDGAISKADLDPLNDREGSLVWPDQDKSAYKAALTAARRIEGMQIVVPDPAWPETYDIGNLIADGWDAVRVMDYIATHRVGADAFEEIFPEASSKNGRAPRREQASLDSAQGPGADDKPVFAARAPFPLARAFVKKYYRDGATRTLHYWGGKSFWRWNGSFYVFADPDEELRCEIGRFLDREVTLQNKDGEFVAPANWHMNNTLAALAAEVQLPATTSPPCWVGNRPPFLQGEHVIAFANGLLDMESGKVYSADPAYFNQSAMRVEYDEQAKCDNWLRFLTQLWGADEKRHVAADQESFDTLQEIMGYLLEETNDLEKMFMFIGPKRSGKGTVGRVLHGMLGRAVVSPALSDFSYLFGLEQIIGKTLAIISDARLDAKEKPGVVVERLLSISGNGNPSIARKNKGAHTGATKTRFLFLANEILALPDVSGALAERTIPLRFRRSFAGHEDPELYEKKLKPELSAIFAWAVGGWRRLRERGGRFVIPDTASGLLDAFSETGNPLAEVLTEVFVLDPEAIRDKDVIYEAYSSWMTNRDRKPATRDWFFRKLNSLPDIDTEFRWDPETKTSRTKDGKMAPRRVKGLKLRFADTA
jgi:P4 family phage/plasmid primase-like protien